MCNNQQFGQISIQQQLQMFKSVFYELKNTFKGEEYKNLQQALEPLCSMMKEELELEEILKQLEKIYYRVEFHKDCKLPHIQCHKDYTSYRRNDDDLILYKKDGKFVIEYCALMRQDLPPKEYMFSFDRSEEAIKHISANKEF